MSQNNAQNPFLPDLATVTRVTLLTPDVKLFTVEPLGAEAAFDYQPGQFAFVSAFGVGEAPFGLCSAAHRGEGLQFAVRRVGTVTAALHALEAGAIVGVRGPYGNYFPLEDYRGKDIVIIGGGIGMAPLRPVIHTIIDRRSEYGDLVIFNGARSPQDLVFADEYDAWTEAPRTRLELTVDRGDGAWQGRVALLPAVVADVKPSAENAVAIICGPPIMIHFTLQELKKLGFADRQIVTTLESKMKCGIGKCARCNVGDKYICQDGPVFTFEEIATFLEPF